MFSPAGGLLAIAAWTRGVELCDAETGKLVRTRHGKSHLRRNRSKRAARDYDEMMPVSSRDLKRVRRLMPYAA